MVFLFSLYDIFDHIELSDSMFLIVVIVILWLDEEELWMGED